jgi:hypothetical protein
MSNITGTSFYGYKAYKVGDPEPSSYTACASSGFVLYINNPSSPQDYNIKTRQALTPTDPLYSTKEIINETVVTIDSTTQFSWGTATTNPATFSTGSFYIEVPLTESTPAPAGTKSFVISWRLRDSAGNAGSTTNSTATEISAGTVRTGALTAPDAYSITGGDYGDLEIVGISASMGATAISNYDNSLRVLDNIYGPSSIVPVLHIGSLTQSTSSFFDNTYFTTNTAMVVSCTADGLSASQLEVTAEITWTYLDFSDFQFHSTVGSYVLGNVSGNRYTRIIPSPIQPFGTSSKKAITYGKNDDAGHSPSILSVQTPSISSSF